MADLEYGPEDFLSFLALMRSVLGILHLVAEFEESVFYIIEAIWWWFPISRRPYGRHSNILAEESKSGAQ